MSIQTQPSAELSEEISIAYFWRSWKRELKKNKKQTNRYPCFYRIHILIPTLPPPERERSKISFTWSIRDRLCIEAGS